jgi:hypothetical protein
MATKKAKQRALITPPGIASYAFVWKPQPSMTAGQEPKYALTLVVSKKADLTGLMKACELAAVKKFGDKALKLIKLGKISLPFRDGDEDREDDELYAGKIFFAAKSNQQPRVVDEDLQPITDQFEFYSGCKCRISVWPYGYDVNGNKGVAFSLNNVQKLGDGERLSGRQAPEDEFGEGDDEDEAPVKKKRVVEDDDEEPVVRKKKRVVVDEDDDLGV